MTSPRVAGTDHSGPATGHLVSGLPTRRSTTRIGGTRDRIGPHQHGRAREHALDAGRPARSPICCARLCGCSTGSSTCSNVARTPCRQVHSMASRSKTGRPDELPVVGGTSMSPPTPTGVGTRHKRSIQAPRPRSGLRSTKPAAMAGVALGCAVTAARPIPRPPRVGRPAPRSTRVRRTC
jgi:hypothetical protein